RGRRSPACRGARQYRIHRRRRRSHGARSAPWPEQIGSASDAKRGVEIVPRHRIVGREGEGVLPAANGLVALATAEADVADLEVDVAAQLRLIAEGALIGLERVVVAASPVEQVA